MKISIRDALFIMTILAMGVAFAHHRSEVQKEFDLLNLNTEHSIAQLKFDYSIDIVDENFRRAELAFSPNMKDFASTVYSGTFDYEFSWWNDNHDEAPVDSEMFVDLIRPVAEAFSGSDGRFIWDSKTTPSLKNLFATETLEGGTIKFQVTYTVPSSADNNTIIRSEIPPGL